jgi:ferredoxin
MPFGEDDLVVLHVDQDVCVGVGVCVASEPEAFVLGDEGVSRARPGRALPRERGELVCRSCPSGAISIVDDGAAVTAAEARP